ncbi:MAG TPA: hypothetical protein VFH29_06040 [Anaerolineales bacterium]|nr:hypothetical protein [Anaerolineales bacterium]
MKISDLFQDAGRPVAYFPRLRRITGSVNAALLLCQLLYWSGRECSDDGWVYKRAEIVAEDPDGALDPSNQSIEFETGLSYKEQRLARQQLRSRGLLRERHDRLKHRLLFKVDFDAVQRLWESQHEQLPIGQVAPAQTSDGTCPSGSTLNGNYIDYTKTTTEIPAATHNARISATDRIPTSPLDALQHPMLQLFQRVCGRVPGVRDYAAVIELMRHFHAQHGEDTTAYLRPYWLAWSSRTRSSDGKPYDPGSLTWLSEWAMNGHIPPTYGGSNARTDPSRSKRSRRRATRLPGPRPAAHQGRALAAEERAAAGRINARRQAKVPQVP